MTRDRPEWLAELGNGGGPVAREHAWNAFLGQHSQLLLYAARSLGGDQDAAMDRYAFLLEELREDDFKRLRSYPEQGQAAFATWLVVVARRLCVDFERRRYGRYGQGGSNGDATESERATRKQLVDLVASEIDPDHIAATTGEGGENPDGDLCTKELLDALQESLEHLDARSRLLLDLRFGQEASAPEIARIMGFQNPFQVYRRTNKVLARLKKILVRRGIDGPAP